MFDCHRYSKMYKIAPLTHPLLIFTKINYRPFTAGKKRFDFKSFLHPLQNVVPQKI